MMNIIKLLIIFALYPLSVSAQEQIENIFYYFNNNTHTATVARGSYHGAVKIPSEVSYNSEKYTVSEIAEKAFYENKEIESVEIPTTITKIGDLAFYGCNNLKKVYIDDLVWWNKLKFYKAYVEFQQYQYTALYNNPLMNEADLFIKGEKVVNLIIPDEVKEVSHCAFSGCSSIEYLEISSKTTYIGDWGFHGCKNLKRVQFNGSGTYRYNSFSGCESLEELIFLGDYTYDHYSYNELRYCSKLTKIVLSKGMLKEVTSVVGAANPDEACLYYQFPYVKEYVIPEGIESIGAMAFKNCDSLRTINIPSSIKQIEKKAFYGCKKLQQVKIEDLKSWCNIVFYTTNRSAYLPYTYTFNSNPLQNGADLYLNGVKLVDLVIPDTISKISRYAFYNCTSLESIEISDKTEVESNAFEGNTNLKVIKSYSNEMGDGCFANCPSLRTAYFYNSLPNGDIGGNFTTFHNCPNLETVLLPKELGGAEPYYSSDQRGNFYKMFPSVKEFIIQDGTTTIGNSIFKNCTNIEKIHIPSSIKVICNNAFDYCPSLKSVYIDDLEAWCNIQFGETYYNSGNGYIVSIRTNTPCKVVPMYYSYSDYHFMLE